MPGARFPDACRGAVYPTWGRPLRRAELHLPLCSPLALLLVMARRECRWHCRRTDTRLIRKCGRRLQRSRKGFLSPRGLLPVRFRRRVGPLFSCEGCPFSFPGLIAFKTVAETMAKTGGA